jgi:hypothetical protein
MVTGDKSGYSARMGIEQDFPPAKLVMGILISRIEMKETLLSRLTSAFGPVDCLGEPIDFTFSGYYDAEMGRPITRLFVSFRELRDGGSLAEVKRTTNLIEKEFMVDTNRKINLDPGFIFLSKFILATTKDGSQRIPLEKGIYAEITLVFENKSFRPVELTYPDYRSPQYIKILNELRNSYRDQLKSMQG